AFKKLTKKNVSFPGDQKRPQMYDKPSV
uniref:Uncharacterized protein n=1 Tax=Ciona intestinalis TaxID=7719 RepID=F6YQK9_CIOIN